MLSTAAAADSNKVHVDLEEALHVGLEEHEVVVVFVGVFCLLVLGKGTLSTLLERVRPCTKKSSIK